MFFPYELSSLPLDMEIEFCIDLIPGTSHVSIHSYRMALAELVESRKQLDELLEKDSYTIVCLLGELLLCLIRNMMAH